MAWPPQSVPLACRITGQELGYPHQRALTTAAPFNGSYGDSYTIRYTVILDLMAFR